MFAEIVADSCINESLMSKEKRILKRRRNEGNVLKQFTILGGNLEVFQNERNGLYWVSFYDLRDPLDQNLDFFKVQDGIVSYASGYLSRYQFWGVQGRLWSHTDGGITTPALSFVNWCNDSSYTACPVVEREPVVDHAPKIILSSIFYE